MTRRQRTPRQTTPIFRSELWRDQFARPEGRRNWPNEELVRYLGSRTTRPALTVEVGCGDGANLPALVAHTEGQVVGVDFCDEALALASGRAPAVEFINGDISADDWIESRHTGVTDLVVDCMASQHLRWSQHLPFYRRVRALLRRGGAFWTYHLDSRTSCERVGHTGGTRGTDWNLVDLFPQAGPICLPAPEMLARQLALAGFTVKARRWLARGYPDERIATYSIMECEAR